MNMFNFFKKNTDVSVKYQEELENTQEIEIIPSSTYTFLEGEIVNISNKLIDTEDEEAIAKFKHNLKVLNTRITENGVKPKFYLIREDDELPNNWQWDVLSKNTRLEDILLPISNEIRKKIASKKYKVILAEKGKHFYFNEEEFNKILSGIDKNIGCVKLPSHFRSTKHFTVNTPLENTGDYNLADTERNFIIIDNMTNFINSGYGYSISYHDAYLDISHECLPISKTAVVLIREDKYEKLIKDDKLAQQLEKRQVILYRGDTAVAINMLLSQLGALSFRVGHAYLAYDEKRYNIMNNSLKQVAVENGFLYDKSHAGCLSSDGGHFTSYFDDMNSDYNDSLIAFYNFLLEAFPDCNLSLKDLQQNNEIKINEFLEQATINEVLKAIAKYNVEAEKSFLTRYHTHLLDSQLIDINIHNLFTMTVKKINEFFMQPDNFFLEERKKLYEAIVAFYQSFDIKKEIEAAKTIQVFLERKKALEENIKEDFEFEGMKK